MTTTPKPKDTPEAEYKRFLETAKLIEASEEPEAFDRAFKRVVMPHKLPASEKGHRSGRKADRSDS